jgi:hypothetical protein
MFEVEYNSSPNIIKVMKSRRLSWAGHAAPLVDLDMQKIDLDIKKNEILVEKRGGKKSLGRRRC